MFLHFDNRRNQSMKNPERYDTQWLFPRDPYPKKGYAYVSLDPIPELRRSFDDKHRTWMKSDPATTGAYDRESINYIITSEEGKKYYHFFKYMLLGSEEHYFVSLLVNWKRTQSHVMSIKSQSVFNSWTVGLPNAVSPGFLTHTMFLSNEMWDGIAGMGKRGVFFARKFSTKKNGKLLDKIDKKLLLSNTSEAGYYWPGFFKVDMISIGKDFGRDVNQNMKLHPEQHCSLYNEESRWIGKRIIDIPFLPEN